MREIKRETTERQVTIITCDFCGKESPYTYSRIRQCCICGKDVCLDCSIVTDADYYLDKPNQSSDYPDYFCKTCWEKGEAIRKSITKARSEAEEIEDRLWKVWKSLT